MLDVLDRDGARTLIPWQEAHRDGIAAEGRQGQALPMRPIAHQRIGHLDQAARSVTNQRIGPDRAAMVEIDQDLQTARDDVMRFSSLDVGDETDAARIVLVAWVVETLSLGRCHRGCSSPDVVGTTLSVAPPRRGAKPIICIRSAPRRIALIYLGAPSRADPSSPADRSWRRSRTPLPCCTGKYWQKADFRPFGDRVHLVKLLLSHQTRGQFPSRPNRELNPPIRESNPRNREAPGKALLC